MPMAIGVLNQVLLDEATFDTFYFSLTLFIYTVTGYSGQLKS